MSWFVTCLRLSLVTILVIKAVQTRDHHRAPKHKHVRGYDADRVTRAHLLWDLLLTRNKHRKDSIPRPVHMRKSMEVHKVPLKLGLCMDQHPLCSSYALNGLCDWPGLFQNLNNIHSTCAFSCGYCKRTEHIKTWQCFVTLRGGYGSEILAMNLKDVYQTNDIQPWNIPDGEVDLVGASWNSP